MKNIIYLAFAMLFSLNAFAQDAVRKAYIEKYKEIAIQQMNKYNIPASIILAQACLESGNGTSRLAVKANNHFGIKCHNWNGKTIYHDDDKNGECFRKYDSVEESYEDHSLFLTNGARYQPLFNLKRTDYKGWAQGLKDAGYATDRRYATMLIDIIEKYELYNYDNEELTGKQLRQLKKEERRRRKEEKQAERRNKYPANANPDSTVNQYDALPAENLVEEVVNPLKGGTIYRYAIDRQIYTVNKAHYIIATGEESYEALAKEYNLFTNELLKFNDLTETQPIRAGEIIFIDAKKNKGETATYVVREGETLHSISQKLGIKMKRLCEYNALSPDDTLLPGTTLKTR